MSNKCKGKMLYPSLVQSILEYSCVVWMSNIDKLQRKAVRFMCNDFSISVMTSKLGAGCTNFTLY